MTTFTNDFSEEIYNITYRFGNETINDTHLRVAKDLAKIEDDPDHWTKQFLWMLKDFKFTPGGRITSNAGTKLEGTTMINCFVDGFIGEDQDSMRGIHDTLGRQAFILKSEGGYGFCADVMRPRGAFIKGIANESPGAVRMLDMWDTQSAVITEGSGLKTRRKDAKVKIRKGAQMVTMSCWHPDVAEYITAKRTPGKLTKFNMSVLITDDLMTAVKNNDKWNLEFPDYEEHREEYKKYWNGNIKEWKERGLATKIYKTFDNANEVWDLIMDSTYNHNEPGVLFVDTMNKMNNLYYNEYISATNPCGEQILPIGGVCLLGSINLTQFVKADDWDYEGLNRIIPLAVRFMDNVNDVTRVPLDIQKDNLKSKRRIGLGILGYGSALMMMKIRYGSKHALELTEKLMEFMSNKAYQSSALLAKEKGSFGLYDCDKYLNSKFVQNLSEKTKSMIREHGIRNSHLLSIQPTGNTSVYANNVSGGLEPIFMPVYVRTSGMPFPPDGLLLPKNVDWIKEKHNGDHWTWIKEGEEGLLKTVFNDSVWKFDRNRGLTRETVVKDYSVFQLEKSGQWDPSADWAATTTQLSIDEHIDTMKIMAKYIDSAMSKTVNIPHDYPYDDFKKIYVRGYETGVIKGMTTYRAGTMTTVLAGIDDNDDSERGNKIRKTIAPERPTVLECDIHTLSIRGEKWMVIIGLLEDDPYEVFAFKQKDIYFNKSYQRGKLIKADKGRYDLETEHFTITDLKKHFESNEEIALTRLISTALRHGADIRFIYQQLMKSEGSIVSFSKAIARTLSNYVMDNNGVDEKCPECNEILVFQEGCKKCMSCSYDKCG